MAAKKQKTMPSSLAKLASDQVFTAHRQVAMEVLDTLWADRDMRAEIEKRVMSKERTNTVERHYDLRETDHVAIIGIDTEQMSMGIRLEMENALLPASRLPKWLFVFLYYWVQDALQFERGANQARYRMRPRCGFGGLYLCLRTRDELLLHYDLLVDRNFDMLSKLFEAFDVDPQKQFGHALCPCGANQEAKDFMRNHIQFKEYIFKDAEDEKECSLRDWINNMDIETSDIHKRKWILPAPVVTVVFPYCGWSS